MADTADNQQADNQMIESVSFLLSQVSRAHRAALERRLAEMGLHAGQEMFLWHLWHEEGQTQSQLASRMCVQPPTINKMLSRMEGAGLVERRLDAEDNRVSHVYLTDQSRQLHESVKDIWHALEAQTVANMTEEEQVLLHRSLKQVYLNLTEKS